MICLLLVAATPTAVIADYVRVKGTVVNVRQGPGTSHPVLFQAEQGEEFDLVSTEGLWCLIKLQEDQEAWVFRKLVDVVQGSRPDMTTSEQAPEESGTSPTVWTWIGHPAFLVFALLLAGLGIWKRKKIFRFTEVRLKEISGYKRDQAFRYDNRKPSDDSWEL
jgi:N-acetylmuramoyl-L-alanine amidase